jgi:hypothetical protein
MLIEPILAVLDLESLLSFLLERDKNGEATSKALSSKSVKTHSDVAVIKHLVPDLYKIGTQHGNLQNFIMTFALRHKISYLNFLFHLKSLAARKQIMDYSVVEKLFDGDVSDDRLTLSLWYKRAFKEYAEGGLLPVLGFSPVGIHFSMRDISLCRAFDVDSTKFCNNPAREVFCTGHIEEAWWLDNYVDKGSTQAKMYRFYSDLKNFYQYSEEDLNNLVAKFWVDYFKLQRVGDNPVLFQKACTFFRIENEQELKCLGLDGLKAKFFALAVDLHPDHGGDSEAFIELKQNYDVLKRKLQMRAA